MAQFALRSRVWLEWVPSAANVADLPSRMRIEEMLAILPGAVYVPTVLPSRGQWQQPFAAFAAEMIAYLA